MLSKKIKSHLREEDEDKNSSKTKKAILEALTQEGVNPNSAFAEFMSTYEGEFYGEEGVIINIGADLLEDNNLTEHFRKTYNVPKKYLPLFNLEVDDFLFYDTSNDSVTLVEAEKKNDFIAGKILPQWANFNDFLIYYFDIDD